MCKREVSSQRGLTVQHNSNIVKCQVYKPVFIVLQEATHGEQFRGDLKRNLQRNVGFDAVMRLRCSTGK